MHFSLSKITATHCCVCASPLTDAESVEHGIGPTCSRRYYNPIHVPTEAQVQIAIGQLAAAELDFEIEEAFLGMVNNSKTNARAGCNLLVKWASAHYANRDIVFKCARIIRALGYVELADKLEADRTQVTLIFTDTVLEAYLPEIFTLARDVRGIPGASLAMNPDDTPIKMGRKFKWTLPLEQADHLETILGVHLYDKLMGGTKGIRVIPRKRWSDVMAFRQPLRSPAVAQGGSVQVLRNANGLLEVYSPYNKPFIDALKAAIPTPSRRWDSNRWLVGASFYSVLQGLVATHYNERI